MATIQAKISRGRKYWYIVESRRINGKPRPVVLAYLGKAEDLLRRLQGMGGELKIKSFTHGAVAALLDLANQLDVVATINPHIHSQRPYWPNQPIRHQLTAGITLLLAAIGRVCMPTSKRSWWSWAQTTSCEYLLGVRLSELDSQHFWDLMDSLPEAAIALIERELLQKTLRLFPLEPDTLLYDTTNFYTFIDSTNNRCQIAQRGKNKQKRNDLRQVGLALVVTRQDYIPLLHYTYRGNIHDAKVFRQVVSHIKKRLQDLQMDVDRHTLVFDRGCNSKKNLGVVKRLQLHYVGALTPSHHEKLLAAAEGHFVEAEVDGRVLSVYREKRMIWGEERTVVVLVSERLKGGQLRGIYQTLRKKKAALGKIQRSLSNPRAKKRTREKLEETLKRLLKGPFLEGLISYELTEVAEGRFVLRYKTKKQKLEALEDRLGFRILMTDRHSWETADIIQAFYGQATVEQAFKNIKNPYHLAVTPEFHWTDQKIKVHYFTCVLGYLLSTLIWRQARIQTGFKGTLDTLLDLLNDIRLARLLEITGESGKPKAIHKLEEMSDEQTALMRALNVYDLHQKRIQIRGVGVYN